MWSGPSGDSRNSGRRSFLNAERFDTILAMQPFTNFPPRGRTEPPERDRADPSVVPSAALLSRGVLIKGAVKFLNELFIDGKVEGTIDSTGMLTIGEHALIRGAIRTKSVNVRGSVEGNILVPEH